MGVLKAASVLGAAERVLTTLWVGGLWVIGYLVTPLLFQMLDDRALAGDLAGRLFLVMGYIGLGCGFALYLAQRLHRRSTPGQGLRAGLIALMLVLTAVGMFVLQPQMAALKQAGLTPGSAEAARFGQLHGIAAVIYLMNSLLGLALVVMGGERRRQSTSSAGQD